MKLYLLATAAALALAGCAGSPMATSSKTIGSHSLDTVCNNIFIEKRTATTGITEKKLLNVYRPELVKRLKAAGASDAKADRWADDILYARVYVGMPEPVAACAWAAKRVNQTSTRYGTTSQYTKAGWFQVSQYGTRARPSYDYFYTENGVVTAVQQ